MFFSAISLYIIVDAQFIDIQDVVFRGNPKHQMLYHLVSTTLKKLRSAVLPQY